MEAIDKKNIDIFERLEENDNKCLNCNSELIVGKRVNIDFKICPNCSAIYTKNAYKSFIPDPTKIYEKAIWKLN